MSVRQCLRFGETQRTWDGRTRLYFVCWHFKRLHVLGVGMFFCFLSFFSQASHQSNHEISNLFSSMDDRWEKRGPPTLTNFLHFFGRDSKCYLKALNELLLSWTVKQCGKGRTNLNRFTTCWLFPGRSGKSLWQGSMCVSEQVSANGNTLPVQVYQKEKKFAP